MRLDRTSRLLCTAASSFPVFLFTVLLLSFFVTAPVSAQSDPAIPSGDIRIHYHRPDGNYSGWTI